MDSLPPTEKASHQHSLRVYHQIQHWLGNKKRPGDWAWERTISGLQPVKTLKPPAPESAQDILQAQERMHGKFQLRTSWHERISGSRLQNTRPESFCRYSCETIIAFHPSANLDTEINFQLSPAKFRFVLPALMMMCIVYALSEFLPGEKSSLNQSDTPIFFTPFISD
ncbi:hypothetical protein AVEN_170367-1 [Araneus ventricosus]|uniref:Uncharacterized protein n=1 Tax=Araneus ventricosus TaxID=182803 RepID=A0A4Y2UBL0_ARAVE|nr:hypothetical protein AVEN_170367-1 [Araneus ventricosus]